MAWPLVNLLDFQGGRYASFGAIATNGLTSAAWSFLFRPPNTTWPTATRILVTRANQFTIRVRPASSGYMLDVGITPPSGSTPIFRAVPATADNIALLKGRMTHFISASYEVIAGVAVIRLWANGHELALVDSNPIPTDVPTVLRAVASNVDLRLASTDSLSASIGNFATWLGVVPTPEMMVAIWNRHAPCDLLSGFGSGPLGEQVAITPPTHWWPCSGDIMPDIEPRIGSAHGTCLPSSPALDTKIPISPVLDLDDFADVRFAIKNGQEGYDTEPYFATPSICFAPVSGDLLVVYSHGSGHSTPNTDSLLQRNAINGQVWAWPNGRAWPGQSAAASIAFDTTEGARGNAICALASGRILHFIGVRSESNPPIPPLPNPPGPPEQRGYSLVRHSDDDGHTWSTWRYVWPGFAFGSPNSGRVVELPGGTLMRGTYREPFVGANYRNCESIISTDQGATWQPGPLIHSGAQDGYEWEEPQLGWISHGHPTGAGGAGWACIARVDYPYPARLFVMYASDLAATQWSAPVFALGGWNSPVWQEAPDGTVYLITRAPDAAGNLDNGRSMLHRSSDGLVTWDAGTWLAHDNAGANMGHGIAIAADGTIHIVVANALVGSAYTGYTILEYLRIDGAPPEPPPDPEPEPPEITTELVVFLDKWKEWSMTNRIHKATQASRPAGEQFDGTEHAALPGEHRLVEANVSFGSEPKIWSIVKFMQDGSSFTIASSGIESSATYLYLNIFELNTLVLPGERVGLVTSGALDEVSCRFYFEKV